MKASLVTIGVGAATPAFSQHICIVCDSPSATYRCAPQDTATKTTDPRFQLACIAELAKAGGHASCISSRLQTGAICNGELKVIALGSTEPAIAPPKPTPAEQEPQTKKPGPPQTVEELAKRTAAASKEQIKKAGQGVGGAVKNTWHCITSLFKDC